MKLVNCTEEYWEFVRVLRNDPRVQHGFIEEADISKARMIVSTITEFEVNLSLVNSLEKTNPNAVFICHADSLDQAAELYELGVSYVMLPHYIGSEKIGAFIKKSGLKKSEFRKFRDKHLAYLQSHFEDDKIKVVED